MPEHALRHGPASEKPPGTGKRRATHRAVRTRSKDFWQATSHVPLETSQLTPGVYRIDLTTRRPVYADLTLTFRRSSRPPLLWPFDMLSPTRYSLVLRLDSASSKAGVVFSPPIRKQAIEELTVRRLGPLALAAFATRKILGGLASPQRMLRSLRQAVRAAGNFKMRSTDGTTRDPRAAYQFWRHIFETESERKRLRTALKAASAKRRPAALAVYSTAANEVDLLEDFLETFGPDLTGSGPLLCKLHLLVVENSQAPLPVATCERVLSCGGVIVEEPTNRLPLAILASEARSGSLEFVVFLDRAGIFPNWAFDAFALEFLSNPECLMVYADSDRLDDSGKRSAPSFKPEWSPEFFLATNYVGAPIAFKQSVLKLSGRQSMAHPKAVSFGLALAAMSRETRSKVQRIPRILFHEAHKEVDDPALERRFREERTEVEEWLANSAIDASLGPNKGSEWHARRITYALPSPAPQVSVIIPSKNNAELLRQAADTVLDASYQERELVIVDNGSTDPAQHGLLEELRVRDGVTVISDPRPFNFSAMNNLGRRSCTGDVLVFLNDDAYTMDRGWLSEMVALAVRSDVGCVGALLLYPDGRIQHAGVTLGVGATVAHAFRGTRIHIPDSNRHLHVRREVGAVTGACLAVRASVFDQVGGFDEALPVSFNDIDLCLRVGEQGYRNLFTPHAVLTHHESTTRKLDASPAQMERLITEEAYFLDKWGPVMLKDPYYSPHLSRAREDFRLRLEN